MKYYTEENRFVDEAPMVYFTPKGDLEPEDFEITDFTWEYAEDDLEQKLRRYRIIELRGFYEGMRVGGRIPISLELIENSSAADLNGLVLYAFKALLRRDAPELFE